MLNEASDIPEIIRRNNNGTAVSVSLEAERQQVVLISHEATHERSSCQRSSECRCRGGSCTVYFTCALNNIARIHNNGSCGAVAGHCPDYI